MGGVTKKHVSLTAAEWELMEYLWENAPCTGREAADHFKKRTGWRRTTTLTLLARVVKKGAASSDDSGGINAYSPLVTREDAVVQEASAFLNRICKGSVSMMVSAITKKQDLGEEEIRELYEILRKADSRAPEREEVTGGD